MDIVALIGRVLFALIFINSGLGHFARREQMTGYAQYRGVPAARLLVPLTGLQILAGGLSVALGAWADLGTLLLAAFLLPTAVLMHPFWKEQDEQAKGVEMAQFFKNVALAGASLALFVAFNQGAFGLTLTDPLFRF